MALRPASRRFNFHERTGGSEIKVAIIPKALFRAYSGGFFTDAPGLRLWACGQMAMGISNGGAHGAGCFPANLQVDLVV